MRATRRPPAAKNATHPSRNDPNIGVGIRRQSTSGRSASSKSIDTTV